MPSVLLPILPGELPGGSGYCFTTWAQVLLDFANAMKAQLEAGQSFYNYGSSVPAPEFQAYPWFRTTDGRWYQYTGQWVSPSNLNANERRIWVGTLTGAGSLEYYDGGEPGAWTPTSGVMWVPDTAVDGRFLVGVGTIPDAGTVVAVGANVGAGQATLVTANVPPHRHSIGVENSDAAPEASEDGRLRDASGDVQWQDNSATTQVGYTRETGGSGTPAAATPFNIVPPGYGVYVIKPSGRLYYRAN